MFETPFIFLFGSCLLLSAVNRFSLNSVNMIKATIFDFSIVFLTVEFVFSLGKFDEISDFVNYLPYLFSLPLVAFLLSFFLKHEQQQLVKSGVIYKIFINLLILLFILTFIVIQGGLRPFLHLWAFCYCLFSLVVIFSIFFYSKPLNTQNFITNGVNIFACLGGLAGLFVGFLNIDELKSIGPPMAFSLMSMFYLGTLNLFLKVNFMSEIKQQMDYYSNRTPLIITILILGNVILLMGSAFLSLK